MSAPIIKAKSFTLTGKARVLDFGFDPDLVIIKKEGTYAYWAHRFMWKGRTAYFTNALAHVSDVIRGFVHHGVALGNNAINAAGQTLYCVAIADNGSGFLRFGGYRGNDAAAPGQTIDVGHTPGVVFIKRDNTVNAFFRAQGINTAVSAANVADLTQLSLTDTGFIVDQVDGSPSDAFNDAGGEGYDWFSLEYNTDYLDILTYDGTGAEIDLNSNSVSWTPCFALVKRYETSPQNAFIKTTDMGSNNSVHLGTGSFVTNALLSLDAGGVTIGTSALVNSASGYPAVMLMLKASDVDQVHHPRLKKTGNYWLRLKDGGVLIPENDDFNLTGSQTWEIHYKPELVDASNSQYLFSRASSPTAAQLGLQISTTSHEGNLQVLQDAHNAYWNTGAASFKNNEYVAHWIYDAVNDLQYLYVNGRLKRKTTGSGVVNSVAAMSITSRTTGYRLAIGGINDGGSLGANGRYTGRIGGVRAYDRALSGAEVGSRADSVLRNHPDTVTDYLEAWACRDGSGTTLSAAVNSANNGVITNGIWIPRL